MTHESYRVVKSILCMCVLFSLYFICILKCVPLRSSIGAKDLKNGRKTKALKSRNEGDGRWMNDTSVDGVQRSRSDITLHQINEYIVFPMSVYMSNRIRSA